MLQVSPPEYKPEPEPPFVLIINNTAQSLLQIQHVIFIRYINKLHYIMVYITTILYNVDPNISIISKSFPEILSNIAIILQL